MWNNVVQSPLTVTPIFLQIFCQTAFVAGARSLYRRCAPHHDVGVRCGPPLFVLFSVMALAPSGTTFVSAC
jgi:hypothetical protein